LKGGKCGVKKYSKQKIARDSSKGERKAEQSKQRREKRKQKAKKSTDEHAGEVVIRVLLDRNLHPRLTLLATVVWCHVAHLQCDVDDRLLLLLDAQGY
jgi:hypothetical protein